MAQRSVMSEEQIQELADGVVTPAEYRSSFRRFRECLSEAGFELANIEDRGARIEYAVPGNAVASGVEPECYEREFSLIDSEWQASNDDPVKRNFMERCIQANGLKVPSTYDELTQLMASPQVDTSLCE